ncbi:hypothetical protein Ndes2526B_g03691 [Nannochloris sp. 'desiccata']
MRVARVFIAFLVLGIVTSHASLATSNLDKASVNAADEQSSSSLLPHHRRSLQQQQQRTLLQSARVVNGWEADPGQFPYTGSLLIDQNCLTPTPSTFEKRSTSSTERRVGFCASSLIMPRVLVSAGHCLYKCSSTAAPDSLPGENPNPKTEVVSWSGPMSVKINQLNITQPTSQVPGAEERIISGAVRNPGYFTEDGLPLDNDIALMWFDTPSRVTPVQIASQTRFQLGQSFMVAGWGYTDPNKLSISDTLRTAVVPFVPRPTCVAKYNSLSTPVEVSRGDICAGSDPNTYADSCSGDSGGPLVMNVTTYLNKSKNTMCVGCAPQQLVGLTSYGESCANDFPGVYTNVPMQADWIDQTITLSNAGGLQKPAIGCSSHVGQRYYGRFNSTLWNIPNAAQCCNACKVNGTASCRGWTWHKNTKRCILIKKVERRTLTGSWTSGNTTGFVCTASSSPPSSSVSSSQELDPNRQVRVSHILLPPGSESTIEDFKSQILNGTATLETLAKEHSTCPSGAARSGDIGWIPKGRTVPEFELASYSTPKGALSTCSTKFGVHLIQVTEERIAADVGNCSVQELAEILSSVRVDQDLLDDIQFIDVRERHEVEIVSLPHFKVLPLGNFQEWAPKLSSLLDSSKKTYVLCHHGMRSMQASQFFLENGFSKVWNISGGIDAYARGVDNNLPRY